MSWSTPYYRVDDPTAFLKAVDTAADADPNWGKHREPGQSPARCAVCIYKGSDFVGRDLWLALMVHGDQPNRVYLTMHARGWGEADDFTATDEQYEAAIALAVPVLRVACRSLGQRMRLIKPKETWCPLRGKIREAFDRFVFHANIQGGLHPLDTMRFYEFIRTANRYASVLEPGDVEHYLRESGFDEGQSERLAEEYTVGRRVLSREWFPWQIRAERKRMWERIRRDQQARAGE